MLQKLRKRQRELEEKQYPDELYGFEAEIYEFFMLVAGSLDYVLANKRIPRHQRRSLEKSFFELYPDILPDMLLVLICLILLNLEKGMVLSCTDRKSVV